MNIALPTNLKHRVFRRDLMSYIIFLVLTIVIGMIIYFLSFRMVQQDVIETRKAGLQQSQEMIDTRLNEISSIVVQMSQDQRIREVSRVRAPLTGVDYEKIRRLHVNFPSYRTTNDFIHDLFVYFERGDFVVSDRYASSRVNLVYNEYFRYLTLDFDEWKHELLYYQPGGFYRGADYILLRNETRRLISFAQAIPIDSFVGDLSMVVILIDEQKLHQHLSRLNVNDEGWYVVQDSAGRVITSMGTPVDRVDYISLNDKSGHGDMVINGEKMAIVYTTSTINDWTYVAAYPTSAISDRIAYIRRVYLFFSLIFIGAGLIIAFILASYKYKPVQNLVTLLTEAGSNDMKVADEYIFLQQSLDKLITSHEHLLNESRSQLPLLRTAFFERLLKSGFKTNQEASYMQSYLDISLNSDYYTVVLIKIKGYDGSIAPDVLSDFNQKRVIITDCIPETNLQTETYHLSHDIVSLILADVDHDTDFEDRLSEFVQTLSLNIEKSAAYSVSIAVGGIVNIINNVHHSCHDASQAFDYIGYRSDMRILWSDRLDIHSGGYQYSLEEQTKLIALAHSGDWDDLSQVLNRIYQLNFGSGLLPKAHFNQLVYDITGTAGRIFHNLNTTDETSVFETYLSQLRNSQSAEMFFVALCNIFQYLIKKTQLLKSDHSTMLINKLTEFIKDPVNKDKLHLSGLSSQFDLSEKYLSSFFKRMTGEKLSSYIEKIMMDRALNLISENKLSIKEISKLAGYSNVNTFYKAFKRIYGMSPSQYKRLKIFKEG